MFGLLFLALGILFTWLLLKGYSSGEIMGRGWGISTRMYRREDQPIWYLITFWSYLFCAVSSIVCAIFIFRSAV